MNTPQHNTEDKIDAILDTYKRSYCEGARLDNMSLIAANDERLKAAIQQLLREAKDPTVDLNAWENQLQSVDDPICNNAVRAEVRKRWYEK